MPNEKVETPPASPPVEAPVEEGQIRSADGTRLFYRHVAPVGPAKARALVVHGFAEHCGRYVWTLRQLATRGLDAWALDLRGFGRSDGGRGCIRRFEEYLDDVDALVKTAAPDRGQVPAFILGHSMGGLVATRFIQERPSGVKGLAVSSPFFRVRMPVPLVKRAAATVLTRIVPGFAMPTNLNPDHLCRDAAIVRAYVEDPLVLRKATTRWFTETMRAQALAFEKAPAMRTPMLLVHGATDRLVDPEATREFFEVLGTPDKKLRLWPELRHEILNEPEKAEVLAFFGDWIAERVAAPAGGS